MELEGILARLRAQGVSLDRVFTLAPEEALRRRPAAGGWSALDNLAHVGRHHEITLSRLHALLSRDTPAFAAYRAEEDPGFAAWQAMPSADVRARTSALRAALVRLVEEQGPQLAQRSARHSSFGSLSGLEWLDHFLLHEAHHLYLAHRCLAAVDAGPAQA